MPECDQIVAMLSDYLDRDLPPDTCSNIERHLAACEACRSAATTLRQTVSLCRQFRAEDTPGPLSAERQRELRAAFEKALEAVRQRARS